MLYRFDDYLLDTQRYELRHLGVVCPLEPQVFAILHYLLAHRQRLVTRQELLDYIWPEHFVSESTLDHRLMQARQAIGDSGQTQRAIQTLRCRGYRFVATVEELPITPLPPAGVTAPPPMFMPGPLSPFLPLAPSFKGGFLKTCHDFPPLAYGGRSHHPHLSGEKPGFARPGSTNGCRRLCSSCPLCARRQPPS